MTSSYYFRFLSYAPNRLDENYNSPKYEEIGSMLKKSRFKKIVELIQHHTGGHADNAASRIEFQNLTVVPRKIHNEAIADAPAAQTGASTARGHGHTGAKCRLDDGGCLFGRLGICHRRRHNLVGGGVRGVKLARKIVECHFAIRRVQCRHLLGGEHEHKLALRCAAGNGINAGKERRILAAVFSGLNLFIRPAAVDLVILFSL